MSDIDLEEESGAQRPGAPVDIGRLLHDLMQRWRVIPIVGAIAAVVGLIYAQRTVKTVYKAHTVLLFEGQRDRAELTTLVDSITLHSNLAEVHKRLKTLPPAKLQKAIRVEFDPDSRLIVVRAEAGRGKAAADLATTVVDVFLDYQERVERTQLEEHIRAVEVDLDAARVRVANAREAYDTFRKQVGVGDFETDRQIALQQAISMKQQAELAGAAADTERARAEKMDVEARRQSKTVTGPSTLINADESALVQAKTQLGQARSRLAPDHPSILALEAEVAKLEERVKSRANVFKSGMSVAPNAAYESLKNGITQAEIQKEIELHKQQTYLEFATRAEKRLEELSRAQGQAQQLLNHIQLAQERLNQLEAERLTTRDALRSPRSHFRIVTPASVPEVPDELTKQKTAFKFPVIAMGLTVIGLLGWSLRGLRVHTAREAGYWANTPVVASSTWPREQETMAALLDELGDIVPRTSGTTLVVAARSNEVPLAREVAYWLGNLTRWPQKALIGSEPEPESRMPTDPRFDQPAIEMGDGTVTRLDAGATSTALVRTASQLAPVGAVTASTAQAWDGPAHGPALRRAARLADRVLVVVASGAMSATELTQLRTRLGREAGIGLLLVGLDPAFERLPDRVGEVDAFWLSAGAVAA